MAKALSACGACLCHTIGIFLAFASLVLTVLGIVCVTRSDDPSLWYKLGLGAFAVAGLLAILLTCYACFIIHRGWKLFGCCGDWTRGKISGRQTPANMYATRIVRRPISTSRQSSRTDSTPDRRTNTMPHPSNIIGMV